MMIFLAISIQYTSVMDDRQTDGHWPRDSTMLCTVLTR